MSKKAGIAYMDERNRYLFVRSLESGKWSFPKGAAEGGDRELLDTALREFKEETGVSLTPGTNCQIENPKGTYAHDTMIFVVRGTEKLINTEGYKNPIKDTNAEIEAMTFLSREQVRNSISMVFTPVVYSFLSIPKDKRNVSLPINDGLIMLDKETGSFLSLKNRNGYFIFPMLRSSPSFPKNIYDAMENKLGFDTHELKRYQMPGSLTLSNNRYVIFMIPNKRIVTGAATNTNKWIKQKDLHADEKYMKRLMDKVINK